MYASALLSAKCPARGTFLLRIWGMEYAQITFAPHRALSPNSLKCLCKCVCICVCAHLTFYHCVLLCCCFAL